MIFARDSVMRLPIKHINKYYDKLEKNTLTGILEKNISTSLNGALSILTDFFRRTKKKIDVTEKLCIAFQKEFMNGEDFCCSGDIIAEWVNKQRKEGNIVNLKRPMFLANERKVPRCPECGLRIRGNKDLHEQGFQHKARVSQKPKN